MRRALDILQSIVGIICILSFPAIFLTMFFWPILAGMLLGIFFIALAASLGLNRFTRNAKISLGAYLVLILMTVMGFTSITVSYLISISELTNTGGYWQIPRK